VEPTAENLPDPMVQKRNPSPRQVEANRKNGRLGGLGRRKLVKWADVTQLRSQGYSIQQIADRLGVSRWTLRRRIVETLRS